MTREPERTVAEGRPERHVIGRVAWAAWVTAVALVAAACTPSERPTRPSILLVVVDTLRRDAVSAYGAVEGTTPTIDALAREGVRYERVWAPSPWTLPSHASLLTGTGLATHRVGTPGRVVLPDDLTTLAERLTGAGYETAAFSENLLVSDAFGMLRGFVHRATSGAVKADRGAAGTLNVLVNLDVMTALDAWRAQRDPARPFFVFVNLFDAHSPYTVRPESPWLPRDTPEAALGRYSARPEDFLCDALPDADAIAVLRGLYLADVHAADAKIRRIRDALRSELDGGALVTVVTSDHGELFGEDRLLGHEFSLNESVLRVPLVVHGLADVAPGVVTSPVSLLDVAPSLLAWAGADPVPGTKDRPLPTSDAPAEPRVLRAAYSDRYVTMVEDWQGIIGFESKDEARRFCTEADTVRGGMAAIIDPPLKYRWLERYPDRLHDLSWDPGELSDLSALRPDETARLEDLAVRWVEATGLIDLESAPDRAPSEATVRALRELGYIE
jgi:arylsulfatase A-like enzyme